MEDKNLVSIQNIIKSLRNCYCNEINTIPELEIKIIQDSDWAKIYIDDLYIKKYLLYISPDLFENGIESIQVIIYHEFTHISDSLIFLNKTRDEYSNIMKIYSETHASQIQLEKMINISHCENIKNDIIYNGNILTIESFLNQTKQHFLSKLYNLTDAENTLIINESDVIYDIYYFSGYLLAIKNKDIKYIPDFSNIPERYKAIVIEIIEYLSGKQCKEYDIEKIQNYHITLTVMIEEDNKKIQERKEEIKRNTAHCPKCGSTQIITGQKDYSLFSRFFGSNKTVNRCANCGYKWKPGR